MIEHPLQATASDLDSISRVKENPEENQPEMHASKSPASSDSGSITERAAMIRDELLGEDSVERHTVQASEGSSTNSIVGGDQSSQKEMHGDDDEELEQRLSISCIAHSLRHIAIAFDEKSRELESLRNIQQTHDEECALLRSQLEAEEDERQTLLTQLNNVNSTTTALEREAEALKREIAHKDELLCFSDRISSRLFDMIHVIRAQVEAAESLSPAIRSLSVIPATSSWSDISPTSASVLSLDSSVMTPPLYQAPGSLDQLFKEFLAKDAPLSDDDLV
ncbi:uncharacterized protein UHOD_05471 [Ustilago sp. UG-2017b]|nr:uncharacterized protein UHOD_05471 [Ustilago sp. UG-2017b]